jgi:hypothetical protein
MAIPLTGLSDKLRQFLATCSFGCDAPAGKPGTAQLVMLRGCRINPDGSLSAGADPATYTDRYDDTLVVFGSKPGGAPYLATFRASAKPGLAWIRHPSYSGSGAGCPTVQPGQYSYVRGLHRGHSALRQAPGAPVVVIRDLDDDCRLEPTDLVDYPVATGINIHAGGTSSRVGLNSSGCQIVWGGWDGGPWLAFHHLTYSVARQQQRFAYTLVDFGMFAAWHDGGRELGWVLYGSRGPDVNALQARLIDSGELGSRLRDGVFGRTTDRALRRWQRRHLQQIDGIWRCV